MYPNVVAEIKRAGLLLGEVSNELGITQTTLSLKLKGDYPFTLAEAKKIKLFIVKAKEKKGITMNIDLPLEVLFEEAS
jgi:hypothetical protein